MKSHLLEAVARHLGRCEVDNEIDNEDRKYLRHLFHQHALFLRAIDATPGLAPLVETAVLAELKSGLDDNIIISN
jgi:hypothetical protein